MNILQSFNYKGQSVEVAGDGYVNLTQMSKIEGKNLGNWSYRSSTKSYLNKIESLIKRPPLRVKKGGTFDGRGTWGHHLAAMHLSRWLSDDFGLAVDAWIMENLGESRQNQPEFKLTPKQQKIVDCTNGQPELQDALLTQCIVYHTPRKLLPHVNEPYSLAATEHERKVDGIERDCTDNFMRDLLEAECLQQVSEKGEIRTGTVWAAINEGRPDDPNERRTVNWVKAEIDRLLPHWNMDWVNPKTKAKAVHWALSAGL